jgi:hypothetical protein
MLKANEAESVKEVRKTRKRRRRRRSIIYNSIIDHLQTKEIWEFNGKV